MAALVKAALVIKAPVTMLTTQTSKEREPAPSRVHFGELNLCLLLSQLRESLDLHPPILHQFGEGLLYILACVRILQQVGAHEHSVAKLSPIISAELSYKFRLLAGGPPEVDGILANVAVPIVIEGHNLVGPFILFSIRRMPLTHAQDIGGIMV